MYAEPDTFHPKTFSIVFQVKLHSHSSSLAVIYNNDLFLLLLQPARFGIKCNSKVKLVIKTYNSYAAVIILCAERKCYFVRACAHELVCYKFNEAILTLLQSTAEAKELALSTGKHVKRSQPGNFHSKRLTSWRKIAFIYFVALVFLQKPLPLS